MLLLSFHYFVGIFPSLWLISGSSNVTFTDYILYLQNCLLQQSNQTTRLNITVAIISMLVVSILANCHQDLVFQNWILNEFALDQLRIGGGLGRGRFVPRMTFGVKNVQKSLLCGSYPLNTGADEPTEGGRLT